MVKALCDQYKLNETDAYMKLLEQFMNIKLKSSTDDPEWLILKIEELDLKMRQINNSYGKTDEEKKAKLLISLPEEYSELVTAERIMPTRTLHDTMKAVREFHKRRFMHKENKVQEIHLVNIECYRCSVCFSVLISWYFDTIN